MGEINNELNHYLQDNRVFADMVNLCVYDGRRVIRPEELTDEESVVYPKSHQGKRSERRNDVSKRCRNGSAYQIFCLENETKINYIMPVRGMEYEAGRYRKQVREITESHEKGDYQDWGELSSGFTREDRLYPVVTLVLYWSREVWDGARSLLEMLDMTEEEKKALTPFLQDYKLNLINMYDLKNTEACDSQLKYVLKLLQMDDDKKAMYEEAASNSEYGGLKADTGRVIAALLGDKDLQMYMEKQSTEGGTVGMCKALDDLKKDAKQQGMEIGKAEGESCFAKLTEKLLGDSRLQDLKAAAQSPAFRKTLYQEYGIEA